MFKKIRIEKTFPKHYHIEIELFLSLNIKKLLIF